MNKPPVKTGQRIQIKITSIGRKGDGVGKYQDFIVMVPQSKVDQEYIVRITDIHETFAFAIIEEVL